jgi:RimJ/RimL family protein N-acetyltransferase
MKIESPVLRGKHVRLEPLEQRHAAGLIAASAIDRTEKDPPTTDPPTKDSSLYRWSPVPQGLVEATAYIDTALAWQDAGTAVSYATVREPDGTVLGSTRFFNIERWAWPQDHPRHNREFPDACEIGYTWLSGKAIRTPANTEAKFLMLAHAFETWQTLRICLHADARNQRSRTAIERIGAKFEGILRSHRMAADYIARNSARYSIVAAEWPKIKQNLIHRLDQPQS